jgi:hypothetical protein
VWCCVLVQGRAGRLPDGARATPGAGEDEEEEDDDDWMIMMMIDDHDDDDD